LCHQVGDEGDVAGQPVELDDDHRAALSAGDRGVGAGGLSFPSGCKSSPQGWRLARLA
jgi:hypothetical protein